MARIPGFHPGGPGSIPGVGESLFRQFSLLQVEHMSQQTKTLLAILKNLFHNSPKSAEFLNIPGGLMVYMCPLPFFTFINVYSSL